MTSVHSAVARSLLSAGADTLFGVLGDANMLYVSDFRDEGGQYIGAADERGAVLMAVGHARMRDGVGAVTVTHGPGLTNALTSLFEASRSRTPLVVLTGDTPLVRDYLQHVDIAAVVAPADVLYRRVLTPDNTYDDVAAAVRLAAAARRPVVLDIPYHLLREQVSTAAGRFQAAPGQPVRADDDALDTALGVIASAARPVVLAGRGAARSGAAEPLRQLAASLGAPVATTLLGRDLFRGDPFDLGVLGTVSHEIAAETVGSSDCVVAFGGSLNPYTTAHGWLVKDRAVVHVDTDPESIGRYGPVTAAVLGDAAAVAIQMADALRAAGHKPSAFRSATLADRLAAHDPRSEFRDASGAETVDVRSAMIRLDELLPDIRTVVTDVGRFVMAPWRYVHAPDPLHFTHTAAFGSIGLGLATAIGASVADRTRPTIAIVGDGGAMMSLLEFTTAVRNELPLILVVVNDRCYGAEWAQLEKIGVDPKMSLMDWPSFAVAAQALGGHGMEVQTLGQLDSLPQMIADGRLPLLVDLRIDPSVAIGDIR